MRDGQRLYVRLVGQGEPCLMLHGFGADSRSWLPFVTSLAKQRSFIIPDLRGFGRSHQVPVGAACALTQFATDLEDVLDTLRVDALPVVGISMGALTAAQSFALFGGARFVRYMHIDQGPVIRNRDDYAFGLLGEAQEAFFARLAQLLDTLSRGHMHKSYAQLPRPLRMELWSLFGEFAAAAVTSTAMQWGLRQAARSETVMRQLLPVANWQVYVDIVRSYLERDYDLRAAFRSIRVPLTVLIGGGSRMYPPAGQRAIAALAPHARVLELPGVGHNLCYQAPRRFMVEFREFLAAA
jgi:pimeloyl-ACP methyl ester carboxylesterase